MTDLRILTKLKNTLSEKWPIIVGMIVANILLLYFFGCESTTRGIAKPEVNVNRAELAVELSHLLELGEARFADLDRKDEVRNMIIQQTALIASSGAVNPIGLVTSLLAVLGVFSTADDLRVRKKLKRTLSYEPTEKT